MKHFLSCDWGTSAFRLRLIDRSNLDVLATVSNNNGCANTNQDWLAQGNHGQERLAYYLDVLAGYIRQLKEKTDQHIEGVPVIISGMATSTIGMVNLPYKPVPLPTNGSGLEIKLLEATSECQQQVFLISGICTTDDVMRGEETKLIGSIDEDDADCQVLILPGTHPKHVYVENGQVITFKTYMTGEFFELLSKKSLLAASVKESDEFDLSFAAGVKEGAAGNLLHSSFLIRTNVLLGKYSPEQNFQYLSGLLIGAELKELAATHASIILLTGEALGSLYQKACEVLHIRLYKILDADRALVKGQHKVLSNLGL